VFIFEPRIQALIFDCDGTLADTMPLHYLAWQQTMQAVGGHFPEKLFYDLAGASNEKIVTTLNHTLGYQFDVSTLAHDKDERYLHLVAQAKPIEAVVAIAYEYKGRLPLAVATGGTRALVQSTLRAIGLSDFFEAVVTAQDVAHPKPAPDIFLECARRLNVAPEQCHVFEDADLGIEGARQAGMTVSDIRLWRV
jgi:beta-phosphoglucomutase family hydrolase